MTHTIDTLIALADEYAQTAQTMRETKAHGLITRAFLARQKLHAALTEALQERDAYQQAADKLACELKASESDVPKIGCVQHDCDECKARAAQPVREPIAWLYPEGLAALKANKCWTAYPSKHDECTIPLFEAAQPVREPDFTKRTNEDYAAWCATYYAPESLDDRGMKSLDGLWAWQEQEKRHGIGDV
jgi:hypothetical protein